MEMKRRVIVAGMGSIGRRHARLLDERPQLSVEYCDPSRAALSRAYREIGERRTYLSFDEALASHPDLIVIATPHSLHAEQTMAALVAGVHVLCEKPMSDRLEDARRMCAAAQKSSAVLSFGFHLHFQPGLRRLKELIDMGALGTIVHAHCRVGSYITLVNSHSRYQADLKGALLLDYAHQPDILFWLMGERPSGVYMVAGEAGDLPLRSNPNFLAVTCDYATAQVSTFHLNYLQMPERHEYEIVGDEGWAVFDLNQGILRLGTVRTSSEAVEQFPVDRDPVYRQEHQAFLDAVDGKRRPESPASDALLAMEVSMAAMQSWRERRRVSLHQAPVPHPVVAAVAT